MGINDFVFGAGENEVITCSSDRSLKVHQMNFDGKAIEEIRQLNLNQAEIEGLKENVDKQQLGCLMA
jgi:hypothetical protein